MNHLNKTLLIRTWTGELPEWHDKWIEQMERLKKYGFDYLIVNGEETIKRVKDKLDIDIDFKDEFRFISDFDPTFGVLFEKEIKGYDFWGHINLDCVYGRLDRFMTDEFLSDCDIFGNDPEAVCGPFSLYRNIEKVNNLFYKIPNWKGILSDIRLLAFDEYYMTELLKKEKDIRFKSGFLQGLDKDSEHIRLLDDGTLLDTRNDKEIMMLHFNKTRKWIYS